MKQKSPSSEVLEHWYTLVGAQQFSSKEFYSHIEEAVRDQKVPTLQSSRVDLAEGGALSDKREYLRFKRERLTFDVCAAPVGVNYFFSYRFYAEPAIIRPWEVLAILVGLAVVFDLSIRAFGLVLGPFLLIVVCGFAAWLMRNAIGIGLRDLDAALLNAPVIGPVYERYFRKDTYYRQDLRIAYCSIVSAIVKQEVAQMTGEKGVKLIREFAYSANHDLYEACEIDVARDRSEPEPALP